jgi:hypothetical protein
MGDKNITSRKLLSMSVQLETLEKAQGTYLCIVCLMLRDTE